MQSRCVPLESLHVEYLEELWKTILKCVDDEDFVAGALATVVTKEQLVDALRTSQVTNPTCSQHKSHMVWSPSFGWVNEIYDPSGDSRVLVAYTSEDGPEWLMDVKKSSLKKREVL